MTERQQRFIQEYLIDLNATQAALRAGYSPQTAYSQGQRLLKKVEIQASIAEAQSARAERVELSQDYVLTNLAEVVERCMQRAPVMVREGRHMVQATDDEGRGVWQFDARGALGGLTLVGKHLGMYVEKHELSGPQGGPIEVMDETRERLHNRIRGLAGRLVPLVAGSNGNGNGTHG